MILQNDFWISALAYVGVFLGVLLAFEGLRQIISRSESRGEARNRRMRMIARGATTEELLKLVKPANDGWFLGAIPVIGTLPRTLRQGGLTISPLGFLGLCLFASMLIAAPAALVLPIPVAAALGLAFGLGFPIMVARQRQKTRIDTLIRQLPDALDLMSRGLRVGHPLNATIASVASDMSDPIAAEFGMMVDQIAYGDALVDAFLDFADRVDVEDVRYLAVSAAIQHGTGGDLAQVLSTLARVIRERLAMRKRIKAISAEGRLTSVFLSLLPFIILVSTSITAPGYYRDIMNDPLFRPFAIIVAVLVVTNFVVMRRLVNFRF